VVENVDSVKARPYMNGAIVLCGSMFGLSVEGTSFRSGGGVTRVPPFRYLKRHRLFLSNLPMLTPPDQCSGLPIIGVYGTGGGGQMTRGYKANLSEARKVMGMPWASREGVSQAIPPAYTQWLGERMLAAITESRIPA
jgi:DNA (cytosine-5)-methyltransferase 1